LEDAGRTVVPITLEVIDKGPCIVVRGEMQIRNAGSVRQTQVWWVIRVRHGKVLSGEDCLLRDQLNAAVARCGDET
jgi:ketosteroid isomerase-like protein